ncbi:hypothetical protein AKJ16_DCAP19886, partial [Drosera capensis]
MNLSDCVGKNPQDIEKGIRFCNMGWLSKIFGGSSPSASNGHYHGTYGEETSWDYDPSVSLV